METVQAPNDALLHECKTAVADILAESRNGNREADLSALSAAEKGLRALPEELLETLARLSADVLTLRAFSQSDGSESAVDAKELLKRLDEELQRTYKKFYDFVYQDLPYCWRQLYTDLSLLKLGCLVASLRPVGVPHVSVHSSGNDSALEEQTDEIVTKAVEALDKALILAGGAGLKRGRGAVERLLKLLETATEDTTQPQPDHTSRPSKRPRLNDESTRPYQWDSERSFSRDRIFNPGLKHPVERFQHMSMQKFQQHMDEGSARGGNGPLPFVVKGLMSDWPAMTTSPWYKPAYLLSRTFGGRRLVPVEVGRTYVDEGWGQELVTFRDFLKRIEETGAPSEPSVHAGRGDETSDSSGLKPVSYLAQHELFTQLPILRNDIPTPDLCYTSPPAHPLSPALNKPETPLPLINAWLGPAGTITPLHTDAYHNLLAQVVGAKYVRLYSPHDTEALCPRGEDEQGIDMHNTSAFDVGVIEGWDALPEGEDARDEIELEEFRGLKYWECILEEGDMLYIPIGWWHYVRSLSVSFSVSFWWNGDHYVEGNEESKEQ